MKDYRVSEWHVTDGLPYPTVAALAQSSDGYLWIGTRTGLGRFDGVSFTNFTHTNLPQLTSDRITSFCEAADGTLWIGTGRGIVCYRSGVWSRATTEKSVEEADISSLLQEPDGSMLISGTEKLFRCRAGHVTELALQGAATVPRLYALRATVQGDVYLAGRGLLRERSGVLADVSTEMGLGKTMIRDFVITSSDSFWLGTQFGLVLAEGQQRRTFSTRDGLPSNSIRSLFIDHDANLWIGTTSGMARYDHGTFYPLRINGVDTLSNVLCLYEDRERNLWVGGDNGLYRLQDVKVDNLTQRDGLPINSILCVLEAKDGTRWVGTYGGGLAHITADGIRTLRMADGLKEDGVNALAEDADGGLWISYYTGGLSYFKNGKFTSYLIGTETLRTAGVGVDAHGTVWANDGRGLYRLTDGKFIRVSFDETLIKACALHIDATGGVWVEGASALGRYFDGHWTLYPTSRHLQENLVQVIFSDAAGDIWLVHEGPTLVRIHAGQQTEFAFPAELGPLVYSGFAYNHELWINFRAGVARIPLAEFEAVAAGRKTTPSYVLYNEPDGMRSRAPNVPGSPGAAPMSDGSLWFSTTGGIAVINPPRIRLNPLPPNVVIERVFADKRELTGPELTHIAPGRGELAFHFTALSLVNASQVRFKYRLQGFDNEWTDAGQRREANYGGLRAGTYRFQVIACNNEGVWNTTGATCEIVLLPHFYERWWFYGALGLVVSGAGAGLYRWRNRHLQRRAVLLQQQNKELEQRIAEHTAELRASYDALRSSEYFYHSLVESLPQVIARKDAAGRYTYVNAAFADLINRPTDQILGHTDAELYPPEIAAKIRADDQRILQLRQSMESEEVFTRPDAKRRYLHVKKLPLFDAQNRPLGVQVLFWDMTLFRETEEKLKTAQKELLEISRLAGIAEMATGVLHNLGNALNSVRVSATIALEKIDQLHVRHVGRVAELLASENHRLADFLTTDERGIKIPGYLTLLATQLEEGRAEAMRELKSVAEGIEHIAEIVAAQQDNALVSGLTEDVSPSELLEYACRMNEAALSRHGVSVTREYVAAPLVRVQRQKTLQILVNLVRNAIDSLGESELPDKRLVLGLLLNSIGQVELSVSDNGVGIAPENLPRIFEFGYTTKKKGHGFGLHSSALAAREMGGSLRVHSDGTGKGAICVLVLPSTPLTGVALTT